MKLTKEILIDWIDRPPSNTDFKIITYIINLQNNRDKAIEYVEEKGRLKYNPNELIKLLKGDSE